MFAVVVVVLLLLLLPIIILFRVCPEIPHSGTKDAESGCAPSAHPAGDFLLHLGGVGWHGLHATRPGHQGIQGPVHALLGYNSRVVSGLECFNSDIILEW